MTLIAVLGAPPHREIWIHLLFLLTQGGICLWEAGRFTAQMAISHTLWAAIVAIEILLLTVFSKKKWATGMVLTLERVITFNPVLNLIRHKPFFYTNASGSWLDGHLPKGYYPYLWTAAILAIIILKIYNHRKNGNSRRNPGGAAQADRGDEDGGPPPGSCDPRYE